MKGSGIIGILGVLVLAIFIGCDDKNSLSNQCSVEFDQQALFASILQDQILPGYSHLSTSLEQLDQDFETLQTGSSAEDLEALENSFSEAYHAWKRVEIFNFGPAEDLQALDYFNLFPLNISKVEDQLSSGFNPDNTMSFDKGLPVLDYFIFNKKDAQERIEYLSRADVAIYFAQALDKMLSISDDILLAYDTGYGADFQAMTGTAAGSSLSLMVNALSQYFENNRRNQLGVPSGAVTLDIPNPDKTEAYFSAISRDLIQTSVSTAHSLYQGISGGPGIRDYLDALEDEVDGEKIANDISDQFNKIINTLPSVDKPLSEAVINDREDVAALYRAMSDQVINLKTDLPSRLCISITYVDNPSDTD